MTSMTNGDVGPGKSVLLDVRGLKKYFPIRRGLLQKTIGHVKAVDDVTFFLNQGETLSLVGESGCGIEPAMVGSRVRGLASTVGIERSSARV